MSEIPESPAILEANGDDCCFPACLSPPNAPHFECPQGHVICGGCQEWLRKCPVCLDPYPKIKIHHISPQAGPEAGESSADENRQVGPIRFHPVHGILVKVSEDGVCATTTGSDEFGGYLAYVFFDRPITILEKLSIRVTMGGQKSVCIIAGYSNQDPATIKSFSTAELSTLFTTKCSTLQIFNPKENTSVVNFFVDEDARVEAEIDGKLVTTRRPSYQTSQNQNVQLTSKMWAFLRFFHQRDRAEIIDG